MLTLEAFHSALANGSLQQASHLQLCDNLTEFPPALFQLADTLEILDLSNNQLRTLPDELTRFTQLRILFASNNPFTELPPVLGKMPALEMIGFKACQIAHVPSESLPPQLRWLILTDNQLQSLPHSIGHCRRLQKLMLSCNQLQSLPASLVCCERLELLRIASNRFESIPDVVFQLPRLAWLALAGNPMTQRLERDVIHRHGTPSIAFQALHIHEQLGEGASGHIYRASHENRGTLQTVALKVFKAGHTSDGTPQSELAAGLAAGAHPHLLTPLGPVHGLPAPQLAMALPLLAPHMQPLASPPSFDSCTRDVYAKPQHFTQSSAHRMLHSMTSALTHLHEQGLLHGDFYAHNILWDAATGDAILSDFGAAALIAELPKAQVAQLQQIELRALRHLFDEVQARTT